MNSNLDLLNTENNNRIYQINQLIPQHNIYENNTSADVQYMQIPYKKICIVFVQIYADVQNNAGITNLPIPTSTVIKRTIGKHIDNSVGRIRFTVSKTDGRLIMNCEEYDKSVKGASISFMYEYV